MSRAWSSSRSTSRPCDAAGTALAGYALEVSQRKRENPLSSTWKAERVVDSGTVETTFEFPHWDDIARRHLDTLVKEPA